MQSVSIPVPTIEPVQVLEIAVSIGGEARRFNYCSGSRIDRTITPSFFHQIHFPAVQMVVSRNDTRHPVRVTLSELGQFFLQLCRHEMGVNLYGVGKQIPWHISSLFHSRLQGIEDHFDVIDVVVDHSIHSRTP